MLVFIACKSLKVVLNNKFVNELLAVEQVHWHVPDRRDTCCNGETPKKTEEKAAWGKSSYQYIIEGDDRDRENDPDQPFG